MDHLRRNVEDGKEVLVIEGVDEWDEAKNGADSIVENVGG